MFSADLRILAASTPPQRQTARRLFREYREWLDLETEQRLGAQVDLCSLRDAQPVDSDDFSPPRGRLLLAECDGRAAVIGALRPLAGTMAGIEHLAEIKHMYVPPEQRGQGIARALLEQLIAEARGIGYRRLRLDTTEFMTAAHSLYRSIGFEEIEPYGDAVRAERFEGLLFFMELDLRSVG